ncbi:MAG: right-handed parallel beta-helix repeat-containing protein, partial [Alphaproteobacteria bacterium]|nr:right-handed parallel beta-helix repeat-containing protein [Alphaproteobacteria bacterium]
AFQYNGDVTLTNVDIQSNVTGNRTDYGIQLRGADALAASGTVTLNNVSVAGTYRAAQLGIQRYDGLSLSMTDVVLGGNTDAATTSSGWGALYLSELGGNDLNIGNTAFLAHSGQYINLGIGALYNTTNNVDATNATFLGKTGATATLAENFAIEDKVFHKLDNAGQGLVTWHEGHLYVTEASGSIQRAIDASDVGGTVRVNDGTFTEQLTINKDLSLLGNGAFNTTILNAPTVLTKSYTQDGREVYAIIHAADAANIDIDGFQINGATNTDNSYTDTKRFVGVAYQNAGGDFTNNWVKDILTTGNTARSGFAFLATDKTGAASTLNLSGNDFTGFQTYGLALADNVNVTLTDNDIVGNKDNVTSKQSGILAISGAKVTANGNRISETDIGVEVTGAANGTYENNVLSGVHNGFDVRNSANTQILGNTIGGNSITGVNIVNSNNSKVVGGTIDTFTNGVIIDNSDNVTVDGVELTNISDTHIAVKDSDNATIQKNTMTGGKTGVKLDSVTNSTVGGADASFANVIRDIVSAWGNTGINIKGGSGLTVSYNDLDNVGGIGIYAENTWGSSVSALNIVNNSIDDNRYNGIYVKHWNGATVNANTITNVSAGHGVELELTTGATANGNVITNVSGNGINLRYGNDGVKLDENTVNTAQNGINVASNEGTNSNVEITNSTISNTRADGIHVESSAGVVINGNDVSAAKGYGIYVSKSDNAIIGTSLKADRNTVSNVDLDGIKISYGSGVTVENNDVSAADRVGIYAEHTNGLLINGNVVDNTTYAIGSAYGGITTDWGQNTTISNNTISRSGHGVMMFDVDGTNKVTGNVIHTVGTNGVNANQVENLTVSGNFIGYTNNVGTVGTANNVGNNGINLNGTANANVIGNDIATARNGVVANAANGLNVYDNDIKGRAANTGTGVSITASSNVNVGNYDQTNWVQTGKWPWQGKFVTTHRDNRIDSFQNGVVVNGGTNNDVVNNTISTVQFGVKMENTTNGNVLDNTITGNSVTGITVDRSNNTLVDGNSLTNFNTGMWLVDSDFVTVTNNSLSNVKDGISARNTDSLTVSANDLTGRGNTGTGIKVTDSTGVTIGGWDVPTLLGSALFQGNNVGSFQSGIDATRVGDLVIEGNRLVGTGSTGTGIKITESHGAKIGGNGSLLGRLKSNFITGFKDG